MSGSTPSSVSYPNGQTLQTSAWRLGELQAFMQELTCGALGIAFDPEQVRLTYMTEGQPFVNSDQDVCYLTCKPKDVDYGIVRHKRTVKTTDAGLFEEWQYTSGWRFEWTFYGPNSLDRSRLLHSTTFMDYFLNKMSAANLYPLPNPPRPTRMPELVNGQWFDRSDFFIEAYEGVVEIINVGAVSSVEIVTSESKLGEVADVTVTAS